MPSFSSELTTPTCSTSSIGPRFAVLEIGDRRLSLLSPEWLPEVVVVRVVEDGDLVLVVGAIREPENQEIDGDGVAMVARRRDDGWYPVHVWHALYPWALTHLAGAGAKI